MPTKSDEYLTSSASSLVKRLRKETGWSQKIIMSAGVKAFGEMDDSERAKAVKAANATEQAEAARADEAAAARDVKGSKRKKSRRTGA